MVELPIGLAATPSFTWIIPFFTIEVAGSVILMKITLAVVVLKMDVVGAAAASNLGLFDEGFEILFPVKKALLKSSKSPLSNKS
jgi:hypothetical protein